MVLARMLALARVPDPWRGDSDYDDLVHGAWMDLYRRVGGDPVAWGELRRIALAAWRAEQGAK